MVSSLMMPLAVVFGSFAVTETQGRGRCYFRNNIYQNGQIFTPPGGTGCLTYLCSHSHVSLQTYGCHVNGTCKSLGEILVINCSTFTCSIDRVAGVVIFQMKNTETRCSGNGRCYDLGETFNRSCSTYTCGMSVDYGQEVYGIRRSVLRCSSNGRCYEDGDTFEDDCSIYTCRTYGVNKLEYFRNRLTTLRCSFNGSCYDREQIFERYCRTYKCRTSWRNDGAWYWTELTRTRCPDYYGDCHEPGSTGLTWKIDGHLHTYCRCRAFSNGTVSYACH